MSNLVLGFISTLIASQHVGGQNSDYVFWASFMICIAALCDGFDGAAARMLKVKEGGIGEQLDTLADMVTFGIAPGYLMYKAVFYNMGDFNLGGADLEYGMLLAALFPACAAYRLARFNVGHDPATFRGLPSPIAGILVALFFLSQRGYYDSFNLTLIIPVYAAIALLMVSTVRYSKPQRGFRSQLAPLRLVLLAVLILSLTFFFNLDFYEIVLFLTLLYIFTGLVVFLILTIKKLRM